MTRHLPPRVVDVLRAAITWNRGLQVALPRGVHSVQYANLLQSIDALTPADLSAVGLGDSGDDSDEVLA